MAVVLLVFTMLLAFLSVHGFARPRLALVLGGGSSRGLSHIGLLKAFEEEGIPVDYIVGTSMGSVVAGLYAAGLSADNLEYMVRHTDMADLFAPSLPPGGGFIDSRRFEIFLDELIDGIDFADAAIPFYTIVINLVTGQEETLHEGRLSRGILASMSVPGLFPPVEIGGQHYIDGGLRNLTPVAVARDTGADVVVAVDVRRTIEHIDHDSLSSNLQLTLMLVLAQETDGALELADIVIAPDVASGSYMDYERMSHFIAEGYRAAKEAAPKVRAALLAHNPEMTFEPRHPGLTEARFAARWQAATEAYERAAAAPPWAFRLAASIYGEGRLATDMALAAPIGPRDGPVPLFVAYTNRSEAGGSTPSFGLGVGPCTRLCGTVFARRIGNGEQWHPGLGVRGRWRQGSRGRSPGGTVAEGPSEIQRTSALAYEAEWIATSDEGNGTGTLASSGATWRLRVGFPATVPHDAGIRWRLIVRNDPFGVYGIPDASMRGELLFKYYFPLSRRDVLEAVRLGTSLYVGAGTDVKVAGGSVLWHPLAEAGLSFEARLFGLYPLRARLGLAYRGGDTAPLSLRFTLGAD